MGNLWTLYKEDKQVEMGRQNDLNETGLNFPPVGVGSRVTGESDIIDITGRISILRAPLSVPAPPTAIDPPTMRAVCRFAIWSGCWLCRR